MSDVKRLHRLQAYFEGEASKSLKSIKITEVYYARTWQILIDRYENKHVNVSSLFDELFKLKMAYQKSSEELKRIYDKVISVIDALADLECPVEHWDHILVYVLGAKLD